MKTICFDGNCPADKPICCFDCEEYETCDDACDRFECRKEEE